MNSQNLLDISGWVVGSGSISGFSLNGSTTENMRALGKNHVDTDVILWEAIPDAVPDADGGWNSSYISIDNNKTYRLSVWIKKTNSNTGTTYFGCQQWQPTDGFNAYTLLNLNGMVNRNPYFFSGDLPQLNRWYLLVSYVYGHTYPNSSPSGGIYDGVTGQRLSYIADFKFTASSSLLRHRAYLYYDTNTQDRQYFYAPRVELVDGNEWSLNKLLNINPDSKLFFTYDNSGNQKQRFYCPDIANCTMPIPPAGKAGSVKQEVVVENKPIQELIVSQGNSLNAKEYTNGNALLKLYPNPTSGIITIKLATVLLVKITFMGIYDINSALVKNLAIDSEKEYLSIDISDQPAGVYFLHMHFNDGTGSITKRIVKQ